MIENKFIKISDGTEIHVSIKETGAPIWLIVTHGLGEHLERHSFFHKLLGRDFNILLYDLRGHGRSGGKKAYIDEFDRYYKDLSEIIGYLKSEYSMKRYILFGHSMGGLITCGLAQQFPENDLYPEKVFLSSPAVAVPGILGNLLRFTPMAVTDGLKSLPWSTKLKGLVDLKSLSHDPHIMKDYKNDELNHLAIHSKLALELVHEAKRVFSRPIRFQCSSYCVVGTGDRIIDPKSVIEYFSLVEKGTQLKIFDGAYHEIHNEIDKYQVPYIDFLKNTLMESLYYP